MTRKGEGSRVNLSLTETNTQPSRRWYKPLLTGHPVCVAAGRHTCVFAAYHACTRAGQRFLDVSSFSLFFLNLR